MNILEKILEEIEQETMTNKEIGRKQCEGMARAMNIVRKYMNEKTNINISMIAAINKEMEDYLFEKYCVEGFDEELDRIFKKYLELGKDTNVHSNWIPIKWRDTTDEDGIDKEKYPIFMDCPMPNGGDEILITLKNGNVLEDTCFDDDGCYLDSGLDWVDDVKAWMPKPEGYKGE